MQKVH